MLLAFSSLLLAVATQLPPRPIMELWPKGNPGGWTRTDEESSHKAPNADFWLVEKVSHPTLEIFKSKSAKPDAPIVIILPGGGYSIEAIEHEGWEIATRLNLAGINAAVLKYRLPNRDTDKPLHKVVLQDAQRAIRLVRYTAHDLGISADHVGIMGFSAGGHASAITSTAKEDSYPPADDVDKLSARPDFTVLIYPAYLNREGTLDLSEGLTVDEHTPPVFIVQAVDDPIPIEGALAYLHACHLAKVPADVHFFATGGHGYGLRSHEPGLSNWPDLLIAWLHRFGG